MTAVHVSQSDQLMQPMYSDQLFVNSINFFVVYSSVLYMYMYWCVCTCVCTCLLVVAQQLVSIGNQLPAMGGGGSS